ncbi:MAG: 2-oxoacid:ferredoxin oxidoreductase subunit beta, partial [Bacteroidota bacterium]
TLFLEDGQPLRFGQDNNKGIRIDGLCPQVVDLTEGEYSADDLWIHDESDMYKSQILVRFFDDPRTREDYLPRPFGVFYETDRPCYEDLLQEQLTAAVDKSGEGDLDSLLSGKLTWTIE